MSSALATEIVGDLVRTLKESHESYKKMEMDLRTLVASCQTQKAAIAATLEGLEDTSAADSDDYLGYVEEEYYRTMSIEMLEKMENKELLSKIYTFIKACLSY